MSRAIPSNSTSTVNVCPELAELDAFLAERLPADRRDVIMHHVERCPSCQDGLRMLADDTDGDLWRVRPAGGLVRSGPLINPSASSEAHPAATAEPEKPRRRPLMRIVRGRSTESPEGGSTELRAVSEQELTNELAVERPLPEMIEQPPTIHPDCDAEHDVGSTGDATRGPPPLLDSQTLAMLPKLVTAPPAGATRTDWGIRRSAEQASHRGGSLEGPGPAGSTELAYLRQLGASPPPEVLSGLGAVSSGFRRRLSDILRPAGYEILGELGRGGMGIVFKARQLRLDRIVALKMILSGADAGGEDRHRFRREAEAVARLAHPHIVQVYEAGEQEGRLWLAMEYVPGGSLADKLADGPMPHRDAARLLELIASGVQAAHDKGIIHRDLKPANVLLTMEGVPKITDFGLAKRTDRVGDTNRSMPAMGTPGYMAPEQISGSGTATSPASDVYSLGAILYEMLTGRPPFTAATPLETLLLARQADVVAPRRLAPAIPIDLDTICVKCLHADPARRYHSAGGLAEDIHRFLSGLPIRARPSSSWEHLIKWVRRRPTEAALSAALVLSLIFGWTLATWQWTRAERYAEEQATARQLADEAASQAKRDRIRSEAALEAAFKEYDNAKQLIKQKARVRQKLVEEVYRTRVRLAGQAMRLGRPLTAAAELDRAAAPELDPEDLPPGVSRTVGWEWRWLRNQLQPLATWPAELSVTHGPSAVAGAGGPVRQVHATPDGERLVVLNAGGDPGPGLARLRVVIPRTGEVLAEHRLRDSDTRVGLSADGRVFVVLERAYPQDKSSEVDLPITLGQYDPRTGQLRARRTLRVPVMKDTTTPQASATVTGLWVGADGRLVLGGAKTAFAHQPVTGWVAVFGTVDTPTLHAQLPAPVVDIIGLPSPPNASSPPMMTLAVRDQHGGAWLLSVPPIDQGRGEHGQGQHAQAPKLTRLGEPSERFASLAWQSDGSTLLAVPVDVAGPVQLERFGSDGQRLTPLTLGEFGSEANIGPIRELLPLPDGRTLATLGDETEPLVRLWSLTSGTALGWRWAGPAPATALATMPSALLVGGADGSLRAWPLYQEPGHWTIELSTLCPGGPDRVGLRSLAELAVLSNQRMRLLTADGDAVTLSLGASELLDQRRLWGLHSAKPTARADADFSAGFALSSIGGWVAGPSAADPTVVKVWRLEHPDRDVGGRAAEPTNHPVLSLAGHSTPITALALWADPSGAARLAAAAGNAMLIWSLSDNGRPLAEYTLPVTGAVRRLRFSPDGQRLMVADDRSVQVIVASSAVSEFRLAMVGATASLAFSPNGQVLATVAVGDTRVRVWSAQRGFELARLPIRHAPTESSLWSAPLAFSPDGHRLAVGDYAPETGPRVRLWAVGHWEPVAELALGRSSGSVTHLAWSPDGRWLLAATAAGWVFGWDGQPTVVSPTRLTMPTATSRHARALAAAQRGDWTRAAAVLDEPAEPTDPLSVGEPTAALITAVIRLRAGDRAGYRRVCAQLWSRLQGRRDTPPDPDWLLTGVRVCTLRSDSGVPSEALLELAESAAARLQKLGPLRPSQSALLWRTLGQTRLRAGRTDAASALQEAARLEPEMPSVDAAGHVQLRHAWSALNAACVGRRREAEQLLEFASRQQSTLTTSWLVAAEVELILQEARECLRP